MNKVNQKDIAESLNVSRVTVTKALKDHPDIAKKTRELIKSKAIEMGYIPNFIGRNLSSKRTYAIGIVLPKIAHSFFAYSVESFYEASREKGYDIIPMISFENQENELENIKTLLSMRVDGIIADIASDSTSESNYELVKRTGCKLLFYDRCPATCNYNSIITNDRKSAFEMVKLMINKGYRKIYHFTGPSFLNISTERRKGYEDAMDEKQMLKYMLNVNLDSQSGYDAMMMLANNREIPDAVFAVNDSVAHGIYKAAHELELNIPGDIAVAGFGDIEYSKLLAPPLTSVKMPIKEMTAEAINTIIEMIEGKKELIGKKIFPSTIIQRGSV